MVSLFVGAHEIPLPGCHITRRLSKNLILFNLPYFSDTSGGTFGRDLLQVQDQFTLEGIWEDDEIENRYDGWPAFGRYELILAVAKKKRITCSLVWKTRTYSIVLKSVQCVKNSGEGEDISYNIVAMRVTDVAV